MKGLDAFITTKEIKQQPRLWEKTKKIVKNKQGEIDGFLNKASSGDSFRIIFTGAGSSSFVGSTVKPYLGLNWDWVESIPTTDIIASPGYYLSSDVPTLLISCARSGNSPESVETVKLASRYVKNLYHLYLTCNPEGSLAQMAQDDPNSLLLLMPEEANDQGFAMTGSFTTMVLASLLIFGPQTPGESAEGVEWARKSGEKILQEDMGKIESLAGENFERAVFLGTSSFLGLAQEASLKLLELSAGKIVCSSDSFLGFRHGPKSVVNDKTMIFGFTSCNNHPRKYERDLLREIAGEEKAKITAFYAGKWAEIEGLADTEFNFDKPRQEIFLLFPYILVAQLLATLISMKFGINPDNPSPEGSLNRVVQGVEIYPLE